MPVTRSTSNQSASGSRARSTQAEYVCLRRRQSPPHTELGPLLSGDTMPDEGNRRYATTLGLYFGHDQALPEKKSFDSTISLHGHKRWIDARSGFAFNTDADDLYKAKIIVDKRKYYVIGTYDQALHDTNTSAIWSSSSTLSMGQNNFSITFRATPALKREKPLFGESLQRSLRTYMIMSKEEPLSSISSKPKGLLFVWFPCYRVVSKFCVQANAHASNDFPNSHSSIIVSYMPLRERSYKYEELDAGD
ncbi:hypothetical protein F5878DRAFT_638919 [Lentinula raphanica]|uniref:Uncharacterized protein n=1 Tax=Lentinula raphanica TaxID=153919 RepID=A0AA38PG58_9AGAR|nr:hypothetical protein F5878DRAFT_638919 [Lentinula raphanica]